ncbi:MAG: oligosaccharide flippase family protein [Candidatus Cloacimonetes bacterium]|nr:oligosaccharide flippase family protein [Candidatus Cloacimonadota bacterium]
MHSYLKKVIHYTAGNIANKLLLLLLLPMFSRFLPPDEYAVYTNIMLFFTFAALIYILGIQQAMYSYFNEQKTAAYQAKLISSVFITILISGIIFTTLIAFFSEKLSLWIVRDIQYSRLFFWVGITLFFNSITSICLSLLNVMERSGSYVIVGFTQNIIFFILLIFGGMNGMFSIIYIFKALFISTVIGSLLGIFIIGSIHRKLPDARFGIFSAKIMLPILRFGLIMIPGTIAMIILRAADRLMLTHLSASTIYRSLYNVGIYSISYKIGSIMLFLITLISTVFLPYAMRIADKEKAPEIYRTMFSYYLWGGGILGFFIILFSPEIFALLIDAQYAVAARLTFIGVISTYLQGIFNLINVIFYAQKRAGNIAVAVILGALINIGLNFLLIPAFGLYGAGAASIFAYLFIVILNYIYAQKEFKPNYKIGYLLITLPLFGIAMALIRFVPFTLISISFKVFFALLFCVGLYLLLLKRGELEKFKAMIRKD